MVSPWLGIFFKNLPYLNKGSDDSALGKSACYAFFLPSMHQPYTPDRLFQEQSLAGSDESPEPRYAR